MAKRPLKPVWQYPHLGPVPDRAEYSDADWNTLVRLWKSAARAYRSASTGVLAVLGQYGGGVGGSVAYAVDASFTWRAELIPLATVMFGPCTACAEAVPGPVSRYPSRSAWKDRVQRWRDLHWEHANRSFEVLTDHLAQTGQLPPPNLSAAWAAAFSQVFGGLPEDVQAFVTTVLGLSEGQLAQLAGEFGAGLLGQDTPASSAGPGDPALADLMGPGAGSIAGGGLRAPGLGTRFSFGTAPAGSGSGSEGQGGSGGGSGGGAAGENEDEEGTGEEGGVPGWLKVGAIAGGGAGAIWGLGKLLQFLRRT